MTPAMTPAQRAQAHAVAGAVVLFVSKACLEGRNGNRGFTLTPTQVQEYTRAALAHIDAVAAEVERVGADRWAILQEQGRTELATKEFVDTLTARATAAEQRVADTQAVLGAERDQRLRAERSLATVEARLREVEAERDDAERRWREVVDILGETGATLEQAEQTADELRRHLRRYGRHESYCVSRVASRPPETPCNCGFDAARDTQGEK